MHSAQELVTNVITLASLPTVYLRIRDELDAPTGSTSSVAHAISADPAIASTDANIPISLGIPAITVDGGGRGRGSHALDESFDQTNSWQGSQRALLLAIALSQQ